MAAVADGGPGSPMVAVGRAINNSGELDTFVWRLLGRSLQPFYRLIGGRHRVWPPSKSSALLLVVGWVALTSPLLLLTRTRSSNRDAVAQRRKEYALSSLENVISNELLRQADPAGADKPPPSADKLFKLLFDELEHHDITAIGVSKTDARFVEGMRLLRVHTYRELREAIDKTKTARENCLSQLQSDSGAGVEKSQKSLAKDDLQFGDGRAMRARMRFAKNQVRQWMRAKSGWTASDEFTPERIAELDALIAEATVYSAEMQKDSRRAMRLIWNLLKPFRGHVAFSTLLIFIADTVGVMWWSQMMQLPYIANNPGTRSQVMEVAFRSCLASFVSWAFQYQANQVGTW